MHTVQVNLFLKEQYILGEPIIATFQAQNLGSEAIGLNLGMRHEEHFTFSLMDPDKRSISKTRLQREGGSSPSPIFLLYPQQSHTQTLILDKWLPICIPGLYEMEWSGPILRQIPEEVLSGRERFIVKPRNAEYLENLCADLAQKALVPPVGNKEACTLLGWVRDPIAIPHIVTVCQGIHVYSEFGRTVLAQEIIPGLRRIGTEEAIAVLNQLKAVRGLEPVLLESEIELAEGNFQRPLAID